MLVINKLLLKKKNLCKAISEIKNVHTRIFKLIRFILDIVRTLKHTKCIVVKAKNSSHKIIIFYYDCSLENIVFVFIFKIINNCSF